MIINFYIWSISLKKLKNSIQNIEGEDIMINTRIIREEFLELAEIVDEIDQLQKLGNSEEQKKEISKIEILFLMKVNNLIDKIKESTK